MKLSLIVLLSLILSACASTSKKLPGTDIDQKVFELNVEKKAVSSRSFDTLNKEIDALNRYIGSYPPLLSQSLAIFQPPILLIHWCQSFETGPSEPCFFKATLHAQIECGR